MDRSEEGNVLDLDWRSVVVDEPLSINAPQHGNISVNYPIGLLQVTYPELAQGFANSQAAAIMREPLFNFQDIGVPMDRWHFLFDPTGSQAGAAGSGFEEVGGARVVSIYSLGESSFREGTFSEKVTRASASLSGAQVEVESSTPPPSGQIQIAGFSRIEKSGDNELAFVTAQAPEGTVTATGGFPIQVLLVLGGMMGAVAVFEDKKMISILVSNLSFDKMIDVSPVVLVPQINSCIKECVHCDFIFFENIFCRKARFTDSYRLPILIQDNHYFILA